MEKIGQSLQDARERLGLTLDEAERSTRIRTHYLEALERGDIDALPSSAQARGFLGNYADFLGLDVNAILVRYTENLQSRRVRVRSPLKRREKSQESSVRIRSRRPRWLSFDLFFATGIMLVIIAIMVWGGNKVMALIRQQPETTATVSGFLLLERTPTPTANQVSSPSSAESAPLFLATETPIPTQPLLLGITGSVNLRIIAENRTWVRVVVDDKEAFNGRLLPGEELEFQGEQTVEVVTGNGAGLRTFYNEQDQGLMGEVGEVVIQLWTLYGIVTPTPTQTYTPTPTEPIEETPLATATPQPAIEG